MWGKRNAYPESASATVPPRPKWNALACSPPPKGMQRWTLTPLEIAVVELNIVDDASNNTIGRPSKNAMKPHLQRQWVIPPEANPPSQPAWRTSWRSIRGHMIRIDPSSAWTTR